MFLKFQIAYFLVSVVTCIASPVNVLQPTRLPLATAPVSVAAHPPLTLARASLAKDVDDFDPNPQYSYGYEVKDVLTGDEKNQHETRDGDNVQGSYSLTEADGTRRIVEYTADPVNGFNAIIRKEGQKQQAVAIGHAPLVTHGPILSHSSILGHTPLLGSAAPILSQPILNHAPLTYGLQGPLHIAPTGLTTFLHR
ncbi:putative insect cuticle protein [Trypoxylus dichotomus]